MSRRFAAVAVLTLASLTACGLSGGDEPPAPANQAAAPGTGSSAATPPGTPGGAPSATTSATTPATTPATPVARPAELPRGGRTVLPDHRVVAFYGEGYPNGIGLLPEDDLDGAAARIEQQANAYASYGRPVLPAMELIATNAVKRPGPDGSYSLKLDDAVVDRYLAAARKHRMLLVLDFQPGTEEFLPQVKRYEKYLSQPDVAIGLDPEWRTPGSRPYVATGHSSAAEINAVERYLVGLVRAEQLPQKLFVVHQFTKRMVPDREQVQVPKELSVVFHMDGVGGPGLKIGGYNALKMKAPFRNGFKVFPVLDKPAMSPAAVMALKPQPEVITYQ